MKQIARQSTTVPVEQKAQRVTPEIHITEKLSVKSFTAVEIFIMNT